MNEHYMVVELPKNDDQYGITLDEAVIFDDYDLAFDMLNQKIAEESGQMFKRPRLKHPLRAALAYRNIELWVVKRTDELITK